MRIFNKNIKYCISRVLHLLLSKQTHIVEMTFQRCVSDGIDFELFVKAIAASPGSILYKYIAARYRPSATLTGR